MYICEDGSVEERWKDGFGGKNVEIWFSVFVCFEAPDGYPVDL